MKETFSGYFKLNKRQHELDFVDVPINNGDIPLFIDPHAISLRNDNWSIDAHNLIVSYFQHLLDNIRDGRRVAAEEMLAGLGEPNQTRLGLSTGGHPRGRGIGSGQASEIYSAFAESIAARTGVLKDIEDCQLLIDGIDQDKISDITTNIIRGKLIDYTHEQCKLYDIRMHSSPSGAIWNTSHAEWIPSGYVMLPVCYERSVILVPKAIARYRTEYNHDEYYRMFVLEFLQALHLRAGDSLVRVLKSGERRKPFKETLRPIYPLSKEYLYQFSKENPSVLDGYRQSKTNRPRDLQNDLIDDLNEMPEHFDFEELKQALSNIPSGLKEASSFHRCIKGVLTAIFYPLLINPVLEQEIHKGRKRIDIAFTNAASAGFFYRLSHNKQVPCAYVFAECKNISSDPANPELDQLSGRFSLNRGHFGFLVCRKYKDKELFYERCKDTANDARGFIVPLDDKDILKLIDFRANNDNEAIDKFLEESYAKLVM